MTGVNQRYTHRSRMDPVLLDSQPNGIHNTFNPKNKKQQVCSTQVQDKMDYEYVCQRQRCRRTNIKRQRVMSVKKVEDEDVEHTSDTPPQQQRLELERIHLDYCED